VLVALYQAPGKKLRMSELADRVVLTPSGLTLEGKRAFLQAWPIYEQGILNYFIELLTEEECRALGKGLSKIHEAHRSRPQ
jgi:hypothetical protein